jgi:hypothetical protein
MTRYIEHRRHTIRHKPGKHLSQVGVTLARTVGNDMGPFDAVITSTVIRAYETPIAMGFAVTGRNDLLSTVGERAQAEMRYEDGRSIADLALATALGGAALDFFEEQAALLDGIAQNLPDGGTALVVSHGGIVEAGAIGALPQADHASWGPIFGYCEGVRLHWNDGEFTDVDILRVAQPSKTR